MKLVKIKGNKPALVVGLYVALLHALWAIGVALGFGQASINWILPLHFISNLYTIVIPFNFLDALVLVIAGFIGGYVATWLFVWVWNAVKK